MIKIEDTVTPSPEQWKAIIMGTRNPMNSWRRSDSFCDPVTDNCNDCPDRGKCAYIFEQDGKPYRSKIGPNDQDLMMRLAKGGPVHAKYRRMIAVYVTITAPLYWWKEFDTYKVGTVVNSCSTMHKIAEKKFTLEDFSCDHLENLIGDDDLDESLLIDVSPYRDNSNLYSPTGVLTIIIKALNKYRDRYLETKDKKYWWQMIQLLPSSYNQKRTVMLNYEILANIYKSRRNHKLDEWRELCEWIKGLPYSELITGKVENEELLSMPIEGLAPNTVRELVGMELISHEVVSDSTPLFLKNSMTIPKED